MTGERPAGDVKEERMEPDDLTHYMQATAKWKARAITAEQERDAAIRAVFDAAPTQWAEIALDKAGFSDEQIRAALSHHQPEENPDA